MIWRSFRRAALGGMIGVVLGTHPLGTHPLGLLAGEPSSGSKQPSASQEPASKLPSASKQLAAADQKSEQAAEPGDFRARTNRALSAAFPATAAERRTQAEKLVSLYTQIGAAKEITPSERARLQARLKSRLARLADAIATDVKQAQPRKQAQTPKQADAASPKRTGSASAGDSAATQSQTVSGGANGGAPQDDGQALVELIQATIAPQSWDVNGGQGTIVYWPAWHVLVVRQTDDVHEQIGGAMHSMRK